MTAIISKIFIVLGAIVMIASLAIFSVDVTYAIVILVIGAALFFLGLSMHRLAKIEDELGKYILLPSNQKAPLKKCHKCGKRYEPDSAYCPYCEIERLRTMSKYR